MERRAILKAKVVAIAYYSHAFLFLFLFCFFILFLLLRNVIEFSPDSDLSLILLTYWFISSDSSEDENSLFVGDKGEAYSYLLE